MTSQGPTTTTLAVAGADMTCSGNMTVTGDRTANNYITSSGGRLKDQVQDVHGNISQQILESVAAKTYVRNDLKTNSRRIGFIAQDILEQLPTEFANVIGYTVSDNDEQLMALDYSRLCPIVWTRLQNTNTRVPALEAKA